MVRSVSVCVPISAFTAEPFELQNLAEGLTLMKYWTSLKGKVIGQRSFGKTCLCVMFHITLGTVPEVPKTLRAMPDIRTGSVRFQLVRNKTSWTEKSLANRFC